MKTPKILTLIIILVIPFTTGCEKKGTSQTAQSTSSKAKWKIGMSQCNLGEPWRVQMNADVKAAANAIPEIEVIFKDAQNDTLKQQAQVEEFTSAGEPPTHGFSGRECRR